MSIPYHRRRKTRAVEVLLHKPSNQVLFSVPEQVLKDSFYKDLPKNLDKNKAISFIEFILGSIISVNGADWRKNNFKKLQGLEVSTQTLKRYFGNYSGYKKYFETKKIIKLVPYQKGIRSNTYNANPNLLWSGLKEVRLMDRGIERKILAQRKKKINQSNELIKKDADSLFWFTTGKIQVADPVKAVNFTLKLKDRSYARAVSSNLTDDRVLRLFESIPDRFINNINSIEIIRNQINRISVDNRGMRQYNALTSMPSILRNFLVYDSQPLVDLDIKNSHSFHLACMLTPKFWAQQLYSYSLNSIHPDLFKYFNNKMIFPKKEILQRIRIIVKNPPSDVIEFSKLVQSGRLYHEISNKLKKRYPGWHGSEKKSKLRINEFLNFDSKTFLNKCNVARRAKKKLPSGWGDYLLFREQFPNVAFVIEALKSRSYKDTSIILQRLESKMFKHYFIRKFSDTYPSVPILVIHDGFITLKSHGELGRELLKSVYEDKIGLIPQVKIKDLSPENAYADLDDYLDSKLPRYLSAQNIDAEIFNAFIDKYSEV